MSPTDGSVCPSKPKVLARSLGHVCLQRSASVACQVKPAMSSGGFKFVGFHSELDLWRRGREGDNQSEETACGATGSEDQATSVDILDFLDFDAQGFWEEALNRAVGAARAGVGRGTGDRKKFQRQSKDDRGAAYESDLDSTDGDLDNVAQQALRECKKAHEARPAKPLGTRKRKAPVGDASEASPATKMRSKRVEEPSGEMSVVEVAASSSSSLAPVVPTPLYWDGDGYLWDLVDGELKKVCRISTPANRGTVGGIAVSCLLHRCSRMRTPATFPERPEIVNWIRQGASLPRGAAGRDTHLKMFDELWPPRGGGRKSHLAVRDDTPSVKLSGGGRSL